MSTIRVFLLFCVCCLGCACSTRSSPASGESGGPVATNGRTIDPVSFSTTIREVRWERRITIDAEGKVEVVTTRETPAGRASERKGGRLPAAARAALTEAFSGWEALRETYAGVADGPGFVITCRGKTVRCGYSPDWPAALARVVRQIEQIGAEIAQERGIGEGVPATTQAAIEANTPLARPADVTVRCLVQDRPDGKVILAYVMNVSDHDVRVWVPGLLGPEIGPGGKDQRPVPVWQERVRPQFGPGDFVFLRPGDLAGRRQRGVAPVGERKLSASYVIYAPGREGRADAIQSVVNADGTVTRPTDWPVPSASPK